MDSGMVGVCWMASTCRGAEADVFTPGGGATGPEAAECWSAGHCLAKGYGQDACRMKDRGCWDAAMPVPAPASPVQHSAVHFRPSYPAIELTGLTETAC